MLYKYIKYFIFDDLISDRVQYLSLPKSKEFKINYRYSIKKLYTIARLWIPIQVASVITFVSYFWSINKLVSILGGYTLWVITRVIFSKVASKKPIKVVTKYINSLSNKDKIKFCETLNLSKKKDKRVNDEYYDLYGMIIYII